MLTSNLGHSIGNLILYVIRKPLTAIQEVMLYVWIAAFAYDELSEYWDAGSLFYAVDVSLF